MKGDRRMTIREVLARVDTIRPNAYTDGEKIAMLNTIEGRIYTDILVRVVIQNFLKKPVISTVFKADE